MDRAQEVIEFEHDPEFLARIVPWMERYGRYFDSEVRGAERLPRSGPALLVGNHSGPNNDPDTPALMAAWYRKNSVDNPLVVLSFDLIFSVPKAGAFFRKLCQVPANHRNAEAALDRFRHAESGLRTGGGEPARAVLTAARKNGATILSVTPAVFGKLAFGDRAALLARTVDEYGLEIRTLLDLEGLSAGDVDGARGLWKEAWLLEPNHPFVIEWKEKLEAVGAAVEIKPAV